MTDYFKFAKQLALTNTTEENSVFDIIGYLYDKFNNFNLGMSDESFLSEYYLNEIINTEAKIDDLVFLNDFIDGIQVEQKEPKQFFLPNSIKKIMN